MTTLATKNNTFRAMAFAYVLSSSPGAVYLKGRGNCGETDTTQYKRTVRLVQHMKQKQKSNIDGKTQNRAVTRMLDI